jgi:hypothetical protein
MSEPLRPEDRDALDRNIQRTVAGAVIKRLETMAQDLQRQELVQSRLLVAALALIGLGLAALALMLLSGGAN